MQNLNIEMTILSLFLIVSLSLLVFSILALYVYTFSTAFRQTADVDHGRKEKVLILPRSTNQGANADEETDVVIEMFQYSQII